MEVPNLHEYLTIQDQMSKISSLNENKLLLSRVFGVLTVILPSYEEGDDDEVKITELSINLPTVTMSFDAQGDSKSNIDYRALEYFKNIVTLSYYDYGRYMRYDAELEQFTEIPSSCITLEDLDEVTGMPYGVYSKGAPGCEASVLLGGQQGEEGNEVVDPVSVVDVKITRSYRTSAEKSEYRSQPNDADGGRYYFESECVVYGVDGRFNEEETRGKCRLSESTPLIRDSANARDAGGSLVLRFSAVVIINKEVFKFANKHMRVVGPTRQNVTDSYTQIRNMFVERPRECAPDDTLCLQEVPNGG
jgi:hypothetical protein